MPYQSLLNFIRSLYLDKETIMLHEPQFIGNEKKYVLDCIDSTYVSSVGKYVTMFEEKMAEFLMAAPPSVTHHSSLVTHHSSLIASSDHASRVTRHDQVYCVAAVNGTAALHLALQVAGVKPGDRVITQPLTFIATANAIRYAGADPVFVDVDKDTLGMSPQALDGYLKRVTHHASHITSSGHSSLITAILPMHTFGHPCRIDEIVEIGNRYGIPVIEDAAESIGSYYKGQHTGTFGLIGTLSFNGNKTLTTGGGGMLVTRHSSLVTRLKHLTTQAKIPHPWKYKHDETGYNYRMPNINAALGVAQLEMLPRFLEAKRLLADRYSQFSRENRIEFITEPEGAISNYWLNAILLQNWQERDAFLQMAYDQGIHCRPAWELMHHLPMFAQCDRGDLSNAESIAERLVNLPSTPIL